MENMQGNMSYLFVAYAVVWVVMFFYLYTISAREKRIQRELRDMNRRLADMGGTTRE
jgi:CcmD family protein